MKPRAAWALLLITMVALTGCASVPGSGPVVTITRPPAQVQADPSIRPAAGAQPDQIINGFISASGTPTTDGLGGASYEGARLFLTAGAADSWQKGASQQTVVLQNYLVSPGGGDSDGKATIILTGTKVGVLDETNTFHPDNSSFKSTVELVKVNGQWRISQPPDALVITEDDFNAPNKFRRLVLYFLDPTGRVLVPDIRYVPNVSSDALATKAISLLINGPSKMLSGVAVNLLAGARLRSNVTTGPEGPQVDLSFGKPPTAATRRALAAQIVYTLSPSSDQQVVISVEGVPLEDKEKTPYYTRGTLSSFDPDITPGNQGISTSPWYINPDGHIASLTQPDTMAWGKLGGGDYRVIWAAASKATGAMAAVVQLDNAKSELVIGNQQQFKQPVTVLVADTLTPPTFNRAGDQVWVVQNGGEQNPEIYQVATPGDDGESARVKIGASQLQGLGEITQIELSPDGVRVAIIAGGKLYVGAIQPVPTDETSESGSNGNAGSGEGKVAANIINLTELRPGLREVAAIAFATSTQLLVASRDPRTLSRVQVDGVLDRTTISSTNLYVDVVAVAVSGADIYVQLATGRILKLEGLLSDGRWVNPKVTSGAELAGSWPFFPT